MKVIPIEHPPILRNLESLCEFNVENEVNLAEEDIAKKRKILSNAERHVCAMKRIKTYTAEEDEKYCR